jgi:DNA-binding MarR family transcriptional regulator
MNLTALALHLGATRWSASRWCDRLEAAGLVNREVSAGSRCEVSLSVSTDGRRRLEAFAATRQEDFARVLDLMSPGARYGKKPPPRLSLPYDKNPFRI